MKQPYLLALLLGGAAIYFGVQTKQAMDRPFPGPGDNAASVTIGSPARVGIAGKSPLSDASSAVSAISARPLFRIDRRPYRELPPPQPPQRDYAAELSRFRLVGVMANGGALSGLVVFSSGTRMERLELRPGDNLPGFVVKEVQPDGLLLEANNRRFPLPMFSGAPTPAQRVRTEGPAKGAATPAPARPPGDVPPVNPKGTTPGRP